MQCIGGTQVNSAQRIREKEKCDPGDCHIEYYVVVIHISVMNNRNLGRINAEGR